MLEEKYLNVLPLYAAQPPTIFVLNAIGYVKTDVVSLASKWIVPPWLPLTRGEECQVRPGIITMTFLCR